MDTFNFFSSPTLLVPGLNSLGYESGFSVRNPNLGQNPAGKTHCEYKVRVTTIRQGLIHSHKDFDFEGMAYFKLYVLSEKLALGAAENTDLYCVNYIPFFSDQTIDTKNIADLEAEWRFRRPQTSGKILTGMIPNRPVGYQYAPIVHLAHYMISSSRVESYVCMANLNITKATRGDSVEQNLFSFDVFSMGGNLLGSFEQRVPFNSTFLVSSLDILNKIGQNPFYDEAFSVLIRGGQSQFTIYTLFLDKESGAIGGEHSLAPAYYTEAVKTSSSRKIFYQNALRKI